MLQKVVVVIQWATWVLLAGLCWHLWQENAALTRSLAQSLEAGRRLPSQPGGVEKSAAFTHQSKPLNAGSNMADAVAAPPSSTSFTKSSRLGEVDPASKGASDHHKLPANQLFAEESIDHSWSVDFADKLAVMFQQSSELSHIKMYGIDCRSSVCQLQFATENQDTLALGIKIGAALAKNGMAEQAYQFNAAAENGVMTVYVGRTADSFSIE